MTTDSTTKILVADDDLEILALVARRLSALPAEVVEASDGEEALAIYAEHSEIIDLVVSDMVMPEKSGLDLFSEIRAIKPDIKFILVTGYCLEEAEGQTLRNMSAILMKPYTTEKIAALIRKVLDE